MDVLCDHLGTGMLCYIFAQTCHVTHLCTGTCMLCFAKQLNTNMLYTCAQVSYVLTWLQVCYVAHLCTGMLLYMCSVIHLAYIQTYGY